MARKSSYRVPTITKRIPNYAAQQVEHFSQVLDQGGTIHARISIPDEDGINQIMKVVYSAAGVEPVADPHCPFEVWDPFTHSTEGWVDERPPMSIETMATMTVFGTIAAAVNNGVEAYVAYEEIEKTARLLRAFVDPAEVETAEPVQASLPTADSPWERGAGMTMKEIMEALLAFVDFDGKIDMAVEDVAEGETTEPVQPALPMAAPAPAAAAEVNDEPASVVESALAASDAAPWLPVTIDIEESEDQQTAPELVNAVDHSSGSSSTALEQVAVAVDADELDEPSQQSVAEPEPEQPPVAAVEPIPAPVPAPSRAPSPDSAPCTISTASAVSTARTLKTVEPVTALAHSAPDHQTEPELVLAAAPAAADLNALKAFAGQLFDCWSSVSNEVWGESVTIERLYDRYFRSMLVMSFLSQIGAVADLKVEIPQGRLILTGRDRDGTLLKVGKQTANALTFTKILTKRQPGQPITPMQVDAPVPQSRRAEGRVGALLGTALAPVPVASAPVPPVEPPAPSAPARQAGRTSAQTAPASTPKAVAKAIRPAAQATAPIVAAQPERAVTAAPIVTAQPEPIVTESAAPPEPSPSSGSMSISRLKRFALSLQSQDAEPARSEQQEQVEQQEQDAPEPIVTRPAQLALRSFIGIG